MSVITMNSPDLSTHVARTHMHRSRRDQWRYQVEQMCRIGHRLASLHEVKDVTAAMERAWDAYGVRVEDLHEVRTETRDELLNRTDEAWDRFKAAYDRAKIMLK